MHQTNVKYGSIFAVIDSLLANTSELLFKYNSSTPTLSARAHIALFSLNELHRATICQRARLQPFNKTFHVVEKHLRSQCVQNFWQTLVSIMAANWSDGCCKLCRTAVPQNFQQSLVLVQMSDFIIEVNVETTSKKKDARRQGIKIAAEYIFQLEKTISF